MKNPQPVSDRKVYYATTSMCPHCSKMLPGEMIGRGGRVYVSRTCPEHGLIEGLACSDQAWFEQLGKFDVAPAKPSFVSQPVSQNCPLDCGLCPSHRQSAGTAAIEISNHCNLHCPVCLADNRGSFSLTPAEVGKIADDFLAGQKNVDAFTLSGGEPTIHPQLFDIIRVLDRPGIARIVINSNGIRIAEDDAFLDELARHPKIYISLHHDGPACKTIRGVEFSVQQKALDRLLQKKINVVPLVLGVKTLNDRALGETITGLLTRSTSVKSIIVSLMAYCGSRGSEFEIDPLNRLTIPEALGCIEQGSHGTLKKADFMPLPMPNPLCAAIGYFIVLGNEITPLISIMDIDRVIEFTKNAHFARAEDELEKLLRETIDAVFANPKKYPDADKLLATFRTLLKDLFPANRTITCEERRLLAEERIKTVYLMQFMDSWTFDSVRLSKCSCQHLLPDRKVIPSCGYYSYHRQFDPRFASPAPRNP